MNDKNDTNIKNLKDKTMNNDSTKTSGNIEKSFFRASAADFKKIPGSPIAYWVSEEAIKSFSERTFKNVADIRGGMSTSNNSRFLRFWYEISNQTVGVDLDKESYIESEMQWFPYNKGGEYRKWYGNRDHVVNWRNDGEEIKHAVVNNPSDPNTNHWSRRIFNTEFFFKDGITWGDISTNLFSARVLPAGSISDSVGIGAYNFKDEVIKINTLCLLNSKVIKVFTDILCPTIHFNSGPMGNIPIAYVESTYGNAELLINIATLDWNSYETAWSFTYLPLLNFDCRQTTLNETYAQLRTHWQEMTLETQRLEEENNRIFIDAYGLQDEL